MKKFTPNYWMYLALASIIFNIFLATQAYSPQQEAAQLLFIQESSDAAVEETDGTYTLTMNDTPEILYFTDRPYRVAGQLNTNFFADLLYDQRKDPPNAILQLERDGEYANIPVELLGASIDESTSNISYTLGEIAVEETQAYIELSHIDSMKFERATIFIDNFRVVGGRQLTSDLQSGKTPGNLDGSSFPPTEDVVKGNKVPRWVGIQGGDSTSTDSTPVGTNIEDELGQMEPSNQN